MTSPTALVTGASSGIGRAFAVALARRGHGIVAVARNEAALKELAAELATDVEVLPADLTDGADLRRVEARLADKTRPVDLLVNNAGYGTTGRFTELPVDGEENEIDLNVVALVRLTHAALGPMTARGAGAVVHVSSIAGFAPAPGVATYSGTKAFVINFGLSLREELRGTGVQSMVLCPGFTRTDFQARASYDVSGLPRFLSQSSEQVVTAALRGLHRGTGLCIPGVHNKAAYVLSKVMPDGLVRLVARRFGGI